MDTVKILQHKIASHVGLSFDDVLLLPSYTDFKRKDVNLTTKLHKNIVLKLPLISSPMDTVTETDMAIVMAKHGGLGVIHRNLNVKKQAGMVAEIKKKKLLVGAAVGTGADLEERTRELMKAQSDIIAIDSGHGHSKFVIDALLYIKKLFPKAVVMAGNVSTYEGARLLIKKGADILRVGMGPGSICTTRVISGMGTPQITAITETVRAANASNIPVVADGGIRQIGDMAKALAFGARAVMLGSLLAHFTESAGKTIVRGGKKYKEYRGMGSATSMIRGSAERYGQLRETNKKRLIAEGVEGLVPYKGEASAFLYQIDGSLRTSLYYLGARNLAELFKKSKFIKTSPAGYTEGHPQAIKIVESGENYLT